MTIKNVNAADGSSNTVVVSSYASVGNKAYPALWRITSEDGKTWVKIGRTQLDATVISGNFDGSGIEPLYIICDENTGAERQADFKVISKYYTGYNKEETLRVVQAAVNVRPKETVYTITNINEPHVLYSDTNTDVLVSYSWIDRYSDGNMETIDSGNSTLTINVEFPQNNTYAESSYSGTMQNVLFTGGLYNGYKDVGWTVVRGAKNASNPDPVYTYEYDISLSKSTVNLSYSNTSDQVTIIAVKKKYADGVYVAGEDTNASWTATISEDAGLNGNLQVSPIQGSGTNVVSISASSFVSAASDTITFTVDDDNTKYQICNVSITAEPDHYLVSGPSSGTYSMYITSPSTDFYGNTISTQGSAYFASGTQVTGHIDINNTTDGRYFPDALAAGVSPSGAATLNKVSDSRIDFTISSLSQDVTFSPQGVLPNITYYTVTNDISNTNMNNSSTTQTSVASGGSVTITTTSNRYRFSSTPSVSPSSSAAVSLTDDYTCVVSNITGDCTVAGVVEVITLNYTVTMSASHAHLDSNDNPATVVENGYIDVYADTGYYFSSVNDLSVSPINTATVTLATSSRIRLSDISGNITITGSATQKQYDYIFAKKTASPITSPNSNIEFTYSGGTGNISIDSYKVNHNDETDAQGLNVSYTSSEAWCVIDTPSLSNGVSSVSFTCLSTSVGGTRTATITATQDETGSQLTYTVTQSAESYLVSVTRSSGNHPVAYEGGTIVISATVTGSTTHYALTGGATRINTPSNGSWWRVSNVTYLNDNTTVLFTITVDANSTTTSRSDTISFTVSSAAYPDTTGGSFTLTQSGLTYYYRIDLSADSGLWDWDEYTNSYAKSFKVTPQYSTDNISWYTDAYSTISAGQATSGFSSNIYSTTTGYINIYPTSANQSGSTITGSITFYYLDATATIDLSQDYYIYEPTYSYRIQVSTNSLSWSYNESSAKSVTVTPQYKIDNGSWQTDDYSRISYSGITQSGNYFTVGTNSLSSNGTISFSPLNVPNTGSQVSGSVTVSHLLDNTQYEVISLTQEELPVTYTMKTYVDGTYMSSITDNNEGGSATVQIKAVNDSTLEESFATGVSISGNESWCSLSSVYTNVYSLTWDSRSLTENLSERSCNITITSDQGSCTLTVTQPAYTYVAPQPSYDSTILVVLDATGRSHSVSVYSGYVIVTWWYRYRLERYLRGQFVEAVTSWSSDQYKIETIDPAETSTPGTYTINGSFEVTYEYDGKEYRTTYTPSVSYTIE